MHHASEARGGVSEEENLCLVLAPVPVSWRAAHSVSSVNHGASDSSYRVCARVCVCGCVWREREESLLLFFFVMCVRVCIFSKRPSAFQQRPEKFIKLFNLCWNK